MKVLIIILGVLVFNGNSIIKASLTITKYDPLSFTLAFTQNLTLPSFEILVDSNSIPYRVLNNQTSSVYDIQVTQDYQPYDPDNTQAFSLVFNYPLDVGSGQLYISNYILSPPKADLYISIGTWPVYLIFSLLLICSLFGIIGIAVIDFIQIYILTAIKFHNKTSVVETYSSLFFFDQSQLNFDIRLYLSRLIRPTVIIIGLFLFGTVAKFVASFIRNHFLRKRVVKFLSYDLFLAVWTITLPSIIYKAFQFISDTLYNKLEMTNQQYIVGVLFTYFNFLNFIAYFYVLYFIHNPKFNQDQKSFRSYMLSSQFQLYNKFHRGLHLKDWIKRNTFLFITIRKIVVVMLFFVSNNISPYVLSLQLVGSFFIFTVRPYKEVFYTNVTIVFNLVWFFFYIMVLEGFFYFDISNTLETRNSLTKYLLTKGIIFHLISFSGVIVAIVEGVRLLKNLRYEFKEQNEVNDNHSPIVITRDRLYTQNSEKAFNQLKDSLIFDSPNSPEGKLKRIQASKSIHHRTKINLFEVEMQDFSPSISNRNLSTRIKKKWKDKSLLEQLAIN